MTNATEMVFGTMDSDKSVSVELKHDDKLPVENNAYLQVNYFHFFKFFLFLVLLNRLLYSIPVYLVNVV
jgi:hypothetical protein